MMASNSNNWQDPSHEIKQVSSIINEKFLFVWTINNFSEFMNRKYEFSSETFSQNVSSSISMWKMVVFPADRYPEGTHVALRLFKTSKDNNSYSVMYTISFVNDSGECCPMQTREKIFKCHMDYDECLVASNREVKEKCLLEDEALTVICKIDLLACENKKDSVSIPCENYDKALQSHDKINIQVINDLSCAESNKNNVHNEKDINTLLQKDSSVQIQKTPQMYKYGNKSYNSDKSLESLSDDLKSLYSTAYKQDVTICVDDGKLKGHEAILASRSSYFKNAFKSHGGHAINIPGINVITLDNILHYLYTGVLKKIDIPDAIDLIKACNLLDLSDLEKMMQNDLKSNMTITNVTGIFQLAKEMKIDSLKKRTLKYIADNHEEVSLTSQWNQMMRNDPHSAGEILLTVASFQNKLTNNGY